MTPTKKNKIAEFFGPTLSLKIIKDVPRPTIEYIIGEYGPFLQFFMKPVQPVNYLFAVLNTYTGEYNKSKQFFARWVQECQGFMPLVAHLDQMTDIFFTYFPDGQTLKPSPGACIQSGKGAEEVAEALAKDGDTR